MQAFSFEVSNNVRYGDFLKVVLTRSRLVRTMWRILAISSSNETLLSAADTSFSTTGTLVLVWSIILTSSKVWPTNSVKSQ